MEVTVQPAILENDSNEIQAKIDRIKGVFPDIQLDVMDGNFVPNTTIHDPAVIDSLDWGDINVELHLMIASPLLFVKKWALDCVTTMLFHHEAAQNTGAVIDLIHKVEKRAVVTINPHTPTYDIKQYLDNIEGVMIMGVEPGFAAQAFNADVLEKIRYLRELKPEMPIYVDGGVNDKTGSSLVDAGASVLCSNSYLFNADDFDTAVANLIGSTT